MQSVTEKLFDHLLEKYPQIYGMFVDAYGVRIMFEGTDDRAWAPCIEKAEEAIIQFLNEKEDG